jgi:1,2-diacylglycerol 3-beta-glucosyltransferase
MSRLARTVFWLYELLVAAMVGYLSLLVLAAWRAPRSTPQAGDSPRPRFAILVPAHNEEKLLPYLLRSMKAQEYPSELFEVHVIADNCTDSTAGVARELGASVHERVDTELRGKPYALNWMMQRLWRSGQLYDAIVILDADSTVEADFLTIVARRLARGEQAIQAACLIRAPEQPSTVSLRYAALTLFNYVRPLGRVQLGGSAGLKGNGMVFTVGIASKYAWTPSLVEDMELHTDLVLAGQRVHFAPDARVWTEVPSTLTNARTQFVRWERGRFQAARKTFLVYCGKRGVSGVTSSLIRPWSC